MRAMTPTKPPGIIDAPTCMASAFRDRRITFSCKQDDIPHRAGDSVHGRADFA